MPGDVVRSRPRAPSAARRGQIAKLRGHRVIATAGSPANVARLLGDLGLAVVVVVVDPEARRRAAV